MQNLHLRIGREVLDDYPAIVQYALSNSTHFSVITEQQKPYSKEPPVCRHDELLESIRGELVSRELNAGAWPGTRTSAKHKVLNRYRIDRNVRKWFASGPNLLQYDPGGLQDLCFYRDQAVWFITITHEEEIILVDPTAEDIQAFGEYGKRKSPI